MATQKQHHMKRVSGHTMYGIANNQNAPMNPVTASWERKLPMVAHFNGSAPLTADTYTLVKDFGAIPVKHRDHARLTRAIESAQADIEACIAEYHSVMYHLTNH